ncbi:WLM domain-containing protein [Zopfochytrium polystomum]|nr:WLM domain-containing protein [Zopfochytrium polystomum]
MSHLHNAGDEQTGSVTVVVSYKGVDHTIQLVDQPPPTLLDLKSAIDTTLNIPLQHQKLLHRRLRPSTPDNTPLVGTVITIDAGTAAPLPRVVLMAASEAEIETVRRAERTLEVRTARQAKDRKAVEQVKRASAAVDEKEASEYCFEGVRVLMEFPDHAAARKLLERLQEDPGIRHVMRLHRWRVGVLTELHPAEETILGFNKNMGQEISLRLRTNDLQGFRHYPTIRTVLLHELAHMVHSEHDSNFHALNRQLNRECDQVTSGGRNVAGVRPSAAFYQPDDHGEGGSGSGSFGGRLGTDGSVVTISEDGSPLPMREVLARAAMARLSKQEQELVDGCGSSKAVEEPQSKE